MSNQAVSITTALASISEFWQPRRLTSVNDYDVKIAKIEGEFVWHAHAETDELFLVVEGELTLQLRDRDVVLRPMDVFVVPKGVDHCPKAIAGASIVMFELQGTVNTGDNPGERTVALQEL